MNPRLFAVLQRDRELPEDRYGTRIEAFPNDQNEFYFHPPTLIQMESRKKAEMGSSTSHLPIPVIVGKV